MEKTFLRGFKSSEFSNRTFCGKCGTTLTFHWTGPRSEEVKRAWGEIFDITLGSLDEESAVMEGLRPDRYFWEVDGVGWVKKMVKDGLVSFENVE